MSGPGLDPESRALVDSALQHAQAIRAEIARLRARDFVLPLPHAVLREISRRADKEHQGIAELPGDPIFASPTVPATERLDTLATHLLALKYLHHLLSLLSRVHSSRLPFELVRPFEGLMAQLLQVESASLLLRPFEEYGFCIRPWAGPDGLLGADEPSELENSFCVMCPSAEVGTFHLFAILAHEFGHPVYQRRVLKTMTDELGAAVDRSTAALFPGGLAGQAPSDDVQSALTTLSRWAEEIFCDLVGVRLLGPAYAKAFHSTLPLFWTPDGGGDWPSSCLRLEVICAGLAEWWVEEPALQPVLEGFPLQRDTRLVCPVPEETAFRIASHALGPTIAADAGGGPSLFHVLLSRVAEHVPSPATWPAFSAAVTRAAERIGTLTPPDPHLFERERAFASPHHSLASPPNRQGTLRNRAKGLEFRESAIVPGSNRVSPTPES